ncbi:MAG: GlxA family transcriptional regulator [Proteobacteria bacterium]|nr:GlxA family transcriptional regulator [Pseudomonadota bacterium]
MPALRKHAATELLPNPIAILLVPHFTSIALSSVIEPLRIANRYITRPYRWLLASVDGEPVPDRNGVKVAVDTSFGALADIGTLLVIADAQPTQRLERALVPGLRRLARAGTTIGGVDTAPLLLARAGLLDGLSATAHWEVLQTFREEFPKVNVTERLFETAERRCTCAGGSAAVDLMLKEIEISFGRQLALRVSEHCMHGMPRPAGAAQRETPSTAGPTPGWKLARAIRILEGEGPKRSKMASVAQAVGVSRRQLHRIFSAELSTSPARFRRKMQLERAHQMLTNAEASVTEVALATGFRSRSHFWRCYRRAFGHPPSRDKR